MFLLFVSMKKVNLFIRCIWIFIAKAVQLRFLFQYQDNSLILH
jgi:hypothetical protein